MTAVSIINQSEPTISVIRESLRPANRFPECLLLDSATGAQKHLPEDCPNPGLTLCEALEAGALLYFPQSPVFPNPEDLQFLLTQKQLESKTHKNIAYKPQLDKVTGVKKSGNLDINRLHRTLKTHSLRSGDFLNQLLPAYRGWQWDYATFRPMEEKGRPLRLRARNDLLHVDSFPTRPLYGGRILRFFTNINPTQERVWLTSETFETLAPQFKKQITLKGQLTSQARPSSLKTLLRRLGLKNTNHSAYDRWMTEMHNTLKENESFQKNCPKQRWAFPPASSWMVMTDMVSHAVLSGQYALEQTVIIPPDKLVTPAKSPYHIIERLYRQQ